MFFFNFNKKLKHVFISMLNSDADAEQSLLDVMKTEVVLADVEKSQ